VSQPDSIRDQRSSGSFHLVDALDTLSTKK